jgi:signal peptidase
MARRRLSDDRTSETDDEADSDEPSSPSGRNRRRPPTHHSKRSAPVRRWRTSDDANDEEDDDELDSPPARRGLLHRPARPVYWRARDSLYFEPLVAVAIIVVMLVSLYAYTGNWPPVYVVESDSMQHGSTDIVGLINTGDLVLAQRVSSSQITPYVVGAQTGYSTYGESGDVILYSPNGEASTPIIHRAIVFLQWNPASASYNATDLSTDQSDHLCGNYTGAVYATPGTPNDCGITGLTGTLDLYHVGWRSVNVSIDLSSANLGHHSGFLTMGDNNFLPSDCTTNCVAGNPDQLDGLSELVEPGWIVGVARGMLPWFGAVKLVLEGNAEFVPPQSWQFLGLTVAGLILLAFGIHYAFRAEGIEDERRKEEEDEEARAAATGDETPSAGRGRRFLRAIRPWGHGDDAADEDDAEILPRRRPPRVAAPPAHGRRGRPHPKVRRSTKPKRRGGAGEDEDL